LGINIADINNVFFLLVVITFWIVGIVIQNICNVIMTSQNDRYICKSFLTWQNES